MRRSLVLRLANTVVFFLATTVVMLLVTETLALLGAREALTALSEETKHTLQELRPWHLLQRFLEIESHNTSCFWKSLGSDPQPPCTPINVDTGRRFFWVRIPAEFVELFFSGFKESWTGGFVTTCQLAVSAIPATILVRKVWWNDPGFVQILAFSVFTVCFSTLLSVPVLAIMYGASVVLEKVIPEHNEFAVFSSSLASFSYGCSWRAVEGGLHHGTSTLIERAISRFRG